MTTVYPKARYRPVSGEQNDPPIIPIGCVLHVDGGNNSSLYDLFNGKSGGVESHLLIARDGSVEQYRDLDHEADANWMGNSWIEGGRRYGLHSVETQGLASGEWTPEQIAAIQEFLAWDSTHYGYPLQTCRTYRSPGVGYHVMFGCATSTSWAKVPKVCPGPDRIAQFHDVLVPWMAEPTSRRLQTVEDDMPYTEKQLSEIVTKAIEAQRDEIATEVWTRFVVVDAKGNKVLLKDAIQALYRDLQARQAPTTPAA